MYAYNPRKKSYQQLEHSMVGSDRWDILNNILEEMNIKKGEGPKQHWMILGPRGIGKSHLMTLLYHKVKDNQDLKKKWIPVLFPEELRRAGNLYKFLERALNEIILEFDHREDTISISNELKQKINQVKASPVSARADNFFSLISWVHDETGKHILLITENMQKLLGKKFSLIEQKKLRAFLQTSNALLIIGSAATVFDTLHDHSHPFFHFFHIRRLEDLDFENMKTLILDISTQKQQPQLSKKVTNGDARLKALYSFTGGNPRMAVFLADILSTKVPEEMLELMDSILDELTPYFESILNGIPDCLEEVINTLAVYEPAQSPGEIAEHLEAPQNSIRNYLKQLKENGYVRVAFSKGKSNYYCLNEYLYRIWFQMRDSSHREETRWLMELLLMLYSRETLFKEQNRLKSCEVDEQAYFSYKNMIDKAVNFVDSYPDYCRMIEWCVDLVVFGEKMKGEMLHKEKRLIKEASGYIKIQRYDEAIIIFNDMLRINPKSERAYLGIGVCLREKEDYEEAIETFRKVVELNPKSEDGYWLLGDCLRSLKRYDEAIESLKEVININPKSFASFGAWGDCLRDLELYEEAEKRYKRAIEINESYKDAYLAWGYSLKSQKFHKKALEKCKEFIKLDPNSERGYFLWGDILIEQKMYKEAIEKFKKVTELNPKLELGYMGLVKCLVEQERYEDAINECKKVIEFNQKSVAAHGVWGECLVKQELYKEAIEKFKRIIEINPKSEEAYRSWGYCLAMLDRYDEAEEKYKKSIEINKDYENGHKSLVFLLEKQERYEEAIIYYENFIHESEDCISIHSYGDCLMRLKRYKESLNQFKRLINLEPECYRVYLLYGELLEKQDDKEDALIAYLNHCKLGFDVFPRSFEFKEVYENYITTLLNTLNSEKYIKQLYEFEKKEFSSYQLSMLLILLSKYDIVSEHIQDIMGYLKKKGKERKEFDLLIFTIQLSLWMKLIDENLNDALKLIELYIKYIKALRTKKKKERDVLNFSLDLLSIQFKYRIKVENVQMALKRMEDEEEVPFSDVIFKVWTCLSEPDSVEAQRYLNEKPIAVVVNEIKEKANSKEENKSDIC